MNSKQLIRDQLNSRLEDFRGVSQIRPPPKGWIRAVRDALGMSARQLAGRLGIAQQAVARTEKHELEGGVTIRTMRRVAESLDCVFVYGLVPNTTLQDTVMRQARHKAATRLSSAAHNMGLEDQSLTREENEIVFNNLALQLATELPPTLWEEP